MKDLVRPNALLPTQNDYNPLSGADSDHTDAGEGGLSNNHSNSQENDVLSAQRVEQNFRFMSILFGANHASVVSCLSLATARFAATGAWQSGILYACYTGSALFGATWVVKKLGTRNALVGGMGLYCYYVATFLLATLIPSQERLFSLLGGAIGGVGAGFLWIAQGGYFSRAAHKHAEALGQPLEQSTNKFGSIFAFYYLAEEVLLRALSSLVGSISGLDWTVVFIVYFLVAVLSTFGMLGVEEFEREPVRHSQLTAEDADTAPESESWWYRSTAALQLLRNDAKTKHMIGLNAVFGFSSAFVGAYVNGEVVKAVFDDSKMVGLLTAWLSIVAACMSLVFEKVANEYNKGVVLIAGSICFAFVAIPFVVFPSVHNWSPLFLVLIYTLQGSGRATFESTLKATFADFFPNEKEGAFANIILQNGSASALGYALSFGLKCKHDGRYCVQFRDGDLHNVLTFEWLVIGTSIVAILSYLRASHLHQQGLRLPVAVEEDTSELGERAASPKSE